MEDSNLEHSFSLNNEDAIMNPVMNPVLAWTTGGGKGKKKRNRNKKFKGHQQNGQQVINPVFKDNQQQPIKHFDKPNFKPKDTLNVIRKTIINDIPKTVRKIITPELKEVPVQKIEPVKDFKLHVTPVSVVPSVVRKKSAVLQKVTTSKLFHATLYIAAIAVNVTLFNYLENLKATECECALKDWRYDYLRVFFGYMTAYCSLMLILSVTEFKIIKKHKEVVLWLIAITHFYVFLSMLIAMSYLTKLENTVCICSVNNNQRLMRWITIAYLVWMSFIAVMGLYFIVSNYLE
jgi:hypothetical protein